MGRKILFVDDEPNILKSLKRIFTNYDYEIFVADTSEKGLAFIDAVDIDVVVADIKMANMGGIEFLRIVKTNFPEIYRVILSGFVEKEIVFKAIMSGVAFDYFVKPWESEILTEKMKQILDVRDILKNDKLIRMINNISGLPKLPEVVGKFMEAVERDEPMRIIADIIAQDISLATKVLQLVNSAFYSKDRISSISKAVMIIGITGMKNILMASHFMDEDKMSCKFEFYLRKEIKRMTKINKLFAKFYEMKYGKRVPEEYLTAGLLFNVGRLIILEYMSERYANTAFEMEKDKELDFYKAEVKLGYVGITHAEIGGYFLELWNFPSANVEIALFYYTPQKAREELKPIIKLLKTADWVQAEFKEEDQNKIINTEAEELKNIHEVNFVRLRNDLGI